MKKVYVAPQFAKPDQGDGGIRRVVEAQIRHLPTYGWQVVTDPYAADVLHCHAGTYCDLNIDRPWVASSHGLYWTAEMDFGDWAEPANAQVLVNLRRADVLTAPSEWVAGAMRRALCCEPVVVGHGIEPEEWEPGEDRGYVLWNKARADVVCDPKEMNKLAAMAPKVQFISTFGQPKDNVTIIGRVPYGRMKQIIRTAGVYLCLARETFGIGTLEAAVAGVPVLGWRHGGQVDIVAHRQHGWLAEPGDWESLREGLEFCRQHRAELGQAARQHVLQHYRWADVIGQYAAVYERAEAEWETRRRAPRVSIIVTCYNLACYLPDCLDSILAQNMADWECIVVDDASSDDTAEVAARYCERDGRIRYIRNEQNQFLAEARNVGIRASRGCYILPLDADDLLAPGALSVLVDALAGDRTIDIAYGHMEAWYPGRQDGPERERGGWPGPFRMERQMQRQNQLPYASMFRRRVWERIGGYRQHIRTAEDADFWCRAVSYGFRPAKVTDAIYLIKRERSDSLGRVEPVSRDWTDWFPWARNPRITPAGALAPSTLKADRFAWKVRSHSAPLVTVVVPVGPGHERAVIKALDSVVAQSCVDWEIVVANDTGEPLALPGFPFARIIDSGARGASAARNAGAAAARGQFLVFLDADDWLHPRFLEWCLDVHQQGAKGAREYVYTDLKLVEGQAAEVYRLPDLDGTENLIKSVNAITTLLPRAAFEEVGGFDERMAGWEDWDFYLALSVAGWCPVHLPDALLAYNKSTGIRREAALANREAWISYLRDKWTPYFSKEKQMACSSCGKRKRTPAPTPTPAPARVEASVVATTSDRQLAAVVDGMVLAEYTSANRGAHRIFGPATRRFYGRRAGGDRFYMDPRDIDGILFRRVE